MGMLGASVHIPSPYLRVVLVGPTPAEVRDNPRTRRLLGLYNSMMILELFVFHSYL